MASDPFHDEAIERAGLPDRVNGCSVVEVVTESTTLSAPAGTAGNWSAHIFTLPFIHSYGAETYFMPGARHTGLTSVRTALSGTDNQSAANAVTGYTSVMDAGPALPAALPMNFVNIHSWSTDRAKLFPDGQTNWADLKPNAVQTFGNVGMGQCRVIGAGIEVVNTTAEIYQQGTVTVSRVNGAQDVEDLPGYYVDSSARYLIGATANSAANSICGPITKTTFATAYGPPATVAAAVSFPNSKQWHAKEGCYSVIAIDVDEADPTPPVYLHRAVMSSKLAIGAQDSAPSLCGGFFQPGAEWDAATFNNLNYVCTPTKTVASDITSIMLTGLSQQSTFSVRIRYIVEKFPRVGDPFGGPDLVRLAAPAAAYDPHALELYRELMRRLVPGVPSKYNPLGEFWNHVVNVVRTIASPIATVAGLIPGPVGQIVSKVAGVAGLAANAVHAANQAKAAATAASQKANQAKQKANAAKQKATSKAKSAASLSKLAQRKR